MAKKADRQIEINIFRLGQGKPRLDPDFLYSTFNFRDFFAKERKTIVEKACEDAFAPHANLCSAGQFLGKEVFFGYAAPSSYADGFDLKKFFDPDRYGEHSPLTNRWLKGIWMRTQAMIDFISAVPHLAAGAYEQSQGREAALEDLSLKTSERRWRNLCREASHLKNPADVVQFAKENLGVLSLEYSPVHKNMTDKNLNPYNRNGIFAPDPDLLTAGLEGMELSDSDKDYLSETCIGDLERIEGFAPRRRERGFDCGYDRNFGYKCFDKSRHYEGEKGDATRYPDVWIAQEEIYREAGYSKQSAVKLADAYIKVLKAADFLYEIGGQAYHEIRSLFGNQFDKGEMKITGGDEIRDWLKTACIEASRSDAKGYLEIAKDASAFMKNVYVTLKPARNQQETGLYDEWRDELEDAYADNDTLINGGHLSKFLENFDKSHSDAQKQMLGDRFTHVKDAALKMYDLETHGQKPVISSYAESLKAPKPLQYFLYVEDFKDYVGEQAASDPEYKKTPEQALNGICNSGIRYFCGPVCDHSFKRLHDVSETGGKVPENAFEVEADPAYEQIADERVYAKNLDDYMVFAEAERVGESMDEVAANAEEIPDQCYRIASKDRGRALEAVKEVLQELEQQNHAANSKITQQTNVTAAGMGRK